MFCCYGDCCMLILVSVMLNKIAMIILNIAGRSQFIILVSVMFCSSQSNLSILQISVFLIDSDEISPCNFSTN